MQKEIGHKTNKKKEEMKARSTERKHWDCYGQFHEGNNKTFTHTSKYCVGKCVYLHCAVDEGIPARLQADDLWCEGNRRGWDKLPYMWNKVRRLLNWELIFRDLLASETKRMEGLKQIRSRLGGKRRLNDRGGVTLFIFSSTQGCPSEYP